MDGTTTIEELKNRIRDFCLERDWGQFHGAKDLAIGAATESAELLEIFRFLSEEQVEALMKDETQRVAVQDELADVLFFLLRFSEKYQIDLSESFFDKMQKNARKYPVEKAKGQNTKYNEL